MKIGKSEIPSTWDIPPANMKTVFANAASRNAYRQGGEGRSTLVYLPGNPDEDHKEFENVAFAALDKFGKPDLDNPIAKFHVATANNGMPYLEHTFYDQYAAEVQTIDDFIQRYGYKDGMKYVATANIVNSATVDTTKALNILDRVLGLQTRQYMLELVVTKIPAPQLVFTVDTYTEGSVQAKVPELARPDIQSHTEARSTQTLFKNVGHIAESEEATFKAIHNTFSLRENWTIRDLARVINSQIATELETATNVAGSDWGAKTGAASDNPPADDVNGVLTTIQGNGFNVDFMCMHDRPAMDFNTNTWVTGPGNVGAAPAGVSAPVWNQKTYQVPGWPTVVVDQAKTNTIATVGSKDAVWLGVGPTIIASYEDVVAGYKGKLVKQWFFPYLAQGGAIRDLTGISA